ncbi:MAG TPA: long-chain fatty acid--CoA ligase [Chloroflexia bacterium]|nr:long-chain fatty acid--CoA ligase [Chloroflexia bacterium]
MISGDWLAKRAQLSPDKVALVDTLHDGRLITYHDWNAAANRTAHFLAAHGVRRGDRVAVLAMNCVEYLDLWFACGKLGAILQPLNWRLTPYELVALVDDATPLVLLYGADFVATVEALQVTESSVRHWIALDGAGQARAVDGVFADRSAQPSSAPPPVAVAADDPWLICYTGGTTGTPKGAVLTHGSICWNAINTVMSWGLTPDDRTILNSPLFHTGGLNVFTAPLVQIGGTSIVCRGFDPAQVFDLIEGAGVTIWFGVPTMFQALQGHPRWPTADFSALKLLISGGAPCPQPVFEAFWARGIDFKTGYGLTEAGPNNFWLPGAQVRHKPGAVGYPLFHIAARVVGPDGRECGIGEVGELLLRGPHVCAGYWGRPEDTATTIRDGWLYTGDLACRDADGAYTIAGRIKDLIISGGENIYPAEVESVLAGHPAVAAVAVIGVPDPVWGEVGRAVIVPHAGATVTPDALISFGQERLARYKVPKRIVFAPTLPLTGAGKVDKVRLRADYGEN